jgi:hypothetical protein
MTIIENDLFSTHSFCQSCSRGIQILRDIILSFLKYFNIESTGLERSTGPGGLFRVLSYTGLIIFDLDSFSIKKSFGDIQIGENEKFHTALAKFTCPRDSKVDSESSRVIKKTKFNFSHKKLTLAGNISSY